MAEVKLGLENIANKVRGKGRNDGGGEVSSNTSTGKRFDRGELVIEAGTNGLRDEDQKKIKEQDRFVEFNEQTQREYTNFLRNHVQGLLRLDPKLLDSKQFLEEKMLYEQLTRVETNESNQPIRDASGNEVRKVDEDKINRFLSTSQGWALANLTLERKADMMIFAMGLEAEMDKRGSREDLIKSFTDRNGIGRGSFMLRFFPNTGSEYSPGAFRRGKETKFKPNAEALQYMQNNKKMGEYMLAMTGIDVNDFTVNGTDVVRSKGVAHTGDADERRSDIVDLLDARRHYYQSLGIDVRRLDATQSQRFTKYVDGSREAIPTVVNAMIDREFKANVRGIKDRAGRSPTHVDFDPSDIDFENTQKRFDKARREVYLTLMKDYVARVDTDAPGLDKPLESLKTKRNELDSQTSETMQRRTEQLRGRQETLTTRQEEIKGLQEDLNQSANDELRKFENGDNELQYRTESGKSFEDSVNEELLKLTQELNISFGGGAGLIQMDQALEQTRIAERQKKYDELLNNKISILRSKDKLTDAMTNQINADAIQYADSIVGRRLAEVKKQIQERDERIAKLKQLLSEHSEKKRQTDESQKKAIEKAPKKLLTDSITAYEELLTTPGTSIDEDMLSNSTVSELYRLVTASGNPFGFPSRPTPEQAGDIRKKLIHAKAEQRAQESENINPTPVVHRDAFRDVLSPASRAAATSPRVVTSEELLTMDVEAIADIMQDPAGSYAYDPARRSKTVELIQRAKIEAQSRLINRYKYSLDEESKDIEQQLKEIDERMKIVSDVSREKEFLDRTISLIDNHREVFSRAYSADKKKTTDTQRLVSGTLSYTSAETSAGQAQGYYELLNILFDYQESPQREKDFQEIYRVLPPEKLADILDTTFNLKLYKGFGPVPPPPPGGPPMPPPATIDNVLSALSRKRLSPRDMRRAAEDVMIRLKDEGIVL